MQRLNMQERHRIASTNEHSTRYNEATRMRHRINWSNVIFVLAYVAILMACGFGIYGVYRQRVELNEKLDRIEKAVMDQYRR